MVFSCLFAMVGVIGLWWCIRDDMRGVWGSSHLCCCGSQVSGGDGRQPLLDHTVIFETGAVKSYGDMVV